MNLHPITILDESIELVVLDIAVEGAPVTEYEVQMTDSGERPVDGGWSAPTFAGSSSGYLVDKPRGSYQLWVRYPADTESVVRQAAWVQVI